jgi:hypothetical protein
VGSLVLANGTDRVVKFNPATGIFAPYNVPTPTARPGGIPRIKLDNI